MPYQVVGAILEVTFKCSHCGHSGTTSDGGDADELVGNSFTLSGFNCPKCGIELEHDDNGHLDWDDPYNDGLEEPDEDDEDDEDDEEDE